MKRIENIEDYRKRFTDSSSNNSRASEALRQALDIRKFEIDMYWKRTTYFWTLIAATFAGFFVLQSKDSASNLEAILLVCCIGLTFSVGWYFVNRGSKYWQNNWERHVDLLEEEVVGPLYKTTIAQDSYGFFEIFSAFPFSVSRINQTLSLFIVAIWLSLVVKTAFSISWHPFYEHISPPDTFLSYFEISS